MANGTTRFIQATNTVVNVIYLLRLTVRRIICGKPIPVLHLRSDVLGSHADDNTSVEEDRNHTSQPEVFEC